MSAGARCRSRAARSSSTSRTAEQAIWTAPPDIIVWREALVEPAEPTWVSAACTTTSWTPSSARAICMAMVTNPWPTSAVAVCTVATGSSPAPSSRRTRAVE